MIRNRKVFRYILISGLCIVLSYIILSTLQVLPVSRISPEHISYTKVEHLTIFISFIYGFVVAVYLKGWSYVVKGWKSIRYSWSHLVWTLFSFFILISVWWNSWIRSGYMEDKLVNFQLSLFPPLILYMISLVIFPDKKQAKKTNLQDHFENNRKPFFRLFLLYFSLNTLLSILFKEWTFIGFTIPFRLIAIFITGIALIVNNKYFHRVLPFIAISVFIWYLIINN